MYSLQHLFFFKDLISILYMFVYMQVPTEARGTGSLGAQYNSISKQINKCFFFKFKNLVSGNIAHW